MRIIHVTPSYLPNLGGIGTIVRDLCETLSTKGFEVTVYSMDLKNGSSRADWINGVLVKRYRCPIGDPFFLPPSSLLRDLRREGAAVIHVHNIQNVFPLFISLTKAANQFLVLQPHYHRYGQTYFRNILFSLYKIVVRLLVTNRANAILANSTYEEKMLKRDFSSKSRALTIEEGLPMSELSNVKRSPEYPKRVLYVGALRKYKKIDVLMRSFKILMDDKKTDYKLVLVGEGPEKQSLVELANVLGISHAIEWKKNLSRQDLLSEYSRASVFVLLSSLESFSIAVNEAVAMGIPTVISRNEVFSELVSKGYATQAASEKPEIVAKAIWQAEDSFLDYTRTKSRRFSDIEEYANKVALLYRIIKGPGR